MTKEKNEVTMDGLVGALLGLDPSSVAAIGRPKPKNKAEEAAEAERQRLLALIGREPPRDHAREAHEARLVERGASSAIGLNRFVRKVLALTLALEDDERAAVRLKSERSARANGWPDARTANAAMVMVWALLDENRRLKGLPDAPLLMASDARNAAGEPLDPTPDESVPTEDLVERMRASVEFTDAMHERRARRDAPPKPEGRPVPSGNAAIRDVLGLEPQVLASTFDNLRHEPGTAFARDPEAAGRAGLNSLLREALTQYGVMKRRKIDQVRLMTEVDAKEGGRPDARSANFCTLLSSGLLCEGYWSVTFLPGRERSPEEADLLERVARHAYFRGSEQAFAALELLCDDDVHFGAASGFTKADLLFQAVRRKHDPDGTHISSRPYGLQLKSLSLNEALRYFLGDQLDAKA